MLKNAVSCTKYYVTSDFRTAPYASESWVGWAHATTHFPPNIARISSSHFKLSLSSLMDAAIVIINNWERIKAEIEEHFSTYFWLVFSHSCVSTYDNLNEISIKNILMLQKTRKLTYNNRAVKRFTKVYPKHDTFLHTFVNNFSHKIFFHSFHSLNSLCFCGLVEFENSEGNNTSASCLVSSLRWIQDTKIIRKKYCE